MSDAPHKPISTKNEGNEHFLSSHIGSRLVSKKTKTVEEYFQGIRNGNKVLLSQAITLVESTHPSHQEKAQKIIEACLPHTGGAYRIGITGTPGVGKSSFIETLGINLIEEGKKVAVLAIDPSSTKTKGSILGDKTRMEKLSAQQDAFIRPSPAGDSLGGVARKTRETILLCEAAGYPTILVETVGVGQSESAVHSMVDFFLLLLLPGAGDELQGIKRGIVEMADIIAINKADGNNREQAKISRKAYANAMHLMPIGEKPWTPKVMTCSALHNEGLKELWEEVTHYFQEATNSGYLERNRTEQARYWLHERIQSGLSLYIKHDPLIGEAVKNIEAAVLSRKKTAFQGASEILELILKNK